MNFPNLAQMLPFFLRNSRREPLPTQTQKPDSSKSEPTSDSEDTTSFALTSPLLRGPEDKQPDWEMIVDSPMWNDTVVPMIEAQLGHVLKLLLKSGPDAEFRYAQGQANALRTLLTTPQAHATLQRQRRAQQAALENDTDEETNDNARRRRNLRRNGTTLRPVPARG